MARDRHREHASGPSQHASRVSEVIRSAIIGTALALAAPSLAVAEVCDKATWDRWSPAHGPVWLLNPIGFPVGMTVIVGGLIVAGVTRRDWLAYLGAVLLVIFGAIVLFADLIPQHQVYRWELQEGCRSVSTDLGDVGIAALFALAYAWVGFRTRRRTPTTPGAHP